MVANFQAEPTARGQLPARPIGNQSRSRQYDSFVVRLWQDDNSDAMLRVEVEHVQAGLSVEAVQVPLDWIVSEISGCLQAPMSTTSSSSADNENRHLDG